MLADQPLRAAQRPSLDLGLEERTTGPEGAPGDKRRSQLGWVSQSVAREARPIAQSSALRLESVKRRSKMGPVGRRATAGVSEARNGLRVDALETERGCRVNQVGKSPQYAN